MKPYRNIKLTECPDVGDIQSEGRRTSVGRIRRGVTYTDYTRNDLNHPVYKVCHNDRGYLRPASKTIIRRNLKRSNRAIEAKFEILAEE